MKNKLKIQCYNNAEITKAVGYLDGFYHSIVQANAKHKIIYKEDICVRLCRVWWRRGESNPCPETLLYAFLRAQSAFWISRVGRPQTG